MRDVFNPRYNQRSIRWSVLIIVILLLLSFALVGHSLFLARGNHVCNVADCATCDVLNAVHYVAGSSAAVAVVAFSILAFSYFRSGIESKIDLSGHYNKTLVNSKIRMNN